MRAALITLAMLVRYLLVFLFMKRAYANDRFTTPMGRSIPYSAVRKYIRYPSTYVLSHLLFEQRHATVFSSYYTHINLTQLNLSTSESLEEVQSSSPLAGGARPLFLQGGGLTFAFSSAVGPLLAAWGPGLQLIPLDVHYYPGLYLNLAVKNHFDVQNQGRLTVSTATVRSSLPLIDITKLDSFNQNSIDYTSDQANNCASPLTLEVAVAYDASFCTSFNNSFREADVAISGLLMHVNNIFLQTVCVRLQKNLVIESCIRKGFESNNGDFDQSTFSLSCDEEQNDLSCTDNSRSLLNFISRQWPKSVGSSARRDVAILVAGYDDGTTVAGATYRAAACSSDLSFAWIEGHSDIVFAHEIGHMLGARHDDEGIMTDIVTADQPLVLSSKSQADIRRFISKDPRSWCLSLQSSSFEGLVLKYDWRGPISLASDEHQSLNISSVTIAPPSGNNQSPTVFMLVSERQIASNGETSTLSLMAANGISCSSNNTCLFSKEDISSSRVRKQLGLSFDENSFGFALTFAEIRSKTSRDIVISHVRKNGNNFLLYYKVGYNVQNDGTPPSVWGERILVPSFQAEDVRCADVASGSISGPGSVDIVHVIIDKRNGLNIAQYRIGFSLDQYGYARGGWTKGIDLHGWYGKYPTSVSVDVVDLNNNGRPELVLYHVDDTDNIKTGFIRVGMDMDEHGHVTGGWTDSVQAAVLQALWTKRIGAMSVGTFGGKYPAVITIERASYVTVPGWHLYIGGKVLTPSLLSTAKVRPRRTELTDGCFHCYNEAYAQQCKKDLDLCGSRVHEVRLGSSSQVVRLNKTTNNQTAKKNLPFSMITENSELTSRQLYPDRPVQPDVDSLYCQGFHYLYSRRMSCDVFDQETVLSKGISEAFISILIEERPSIRTFINSTTLFEDPGGTQGKPKLPLAATIRISDRRQNYKDVVSNAIKRLTMQPKFKHVFEKDFIVRRENEGETIVVKIYFKNKKKYIS